MNFGNAQLGDRRRTKRLVVVADAITRHPGGSLPHQLRSPAQLGALDHLMKSPAVTHKTVLAPHYERTFARMAEHDRPVLVIHDTSRRPDAKERPATDFVSAESVAVLSAWRQGSEQPDWTISDFCFALAR